jgi:hypothetical protein
MYCPSFIHVVRMSHINVVCHSSHFVSWCSLEQVIHSSQPLLALALALYYRTFLRKECPKHHGHNGDPTIIHEICGTVGEEALVWMKALGVGNASHP